MTPRRPGRAPLPRIGLGCAPLGNLFQSVSDENAAATVDAAWDCGIRMFDTAPLYGFGLSERRLGAAIARRPRAEVILSTKVGRLLVSEGGDPPEDHPFVDAAELRPKLDFSRDGVMRSFDASLERLQTDRIDIVYVHDPDLHLDEAVDTAVPALLELRDQGVIDRVGCGMNDAACLAEVVRRSELDTVLIAGRYTLLDQSALDELFVRCEQLNVDVVVGGVFNSGILVDPSKSATYDYAPASREVMTRVEALRHLCDAAGVPLSTAALQFPFTHPQVTSVLVGARSPNEVQTNHDQLAKHVPPGFWEALVAAGLLDERALVD